MNCRKCKKEIPEESSFCLFCGVNQTTPKQKTKSRGNGQGSVYKLPSGLYKAAVTLGYTLEGKRVVRTKSGFKTKKEALEYLPVLRHSIYLLCQHYHYMNFHHLMCLQTVNYPMLLHRLICLWTVSLLKLLHHCL